MGTRTAAELVDQWHRPLGCGKARHHETGVAVSFASATWGFTGLAAAAWERWLKQR
jgi:hypothetical protein